MKKVNLKPCLERIFTTIEPRRGATSGMPQEVLQVEHEQFNKSIEDLIWEWVEGEAIFYGFQSQQRL